jgi:hypothetical protein
MAPSETRERLVTDTSDGPDFSQQLFELADKLGMSEDEHVVGLRSELNQQQCAARILRICELASLPVARTKEDPGVVITAVHPGPQAQAYMAGGLRVYWRGSQALEADGDESPGQPHEDLWSAVRHSMESALAAILESGGCHTVLDSMESDVVVLGLTAAPWIDDTETP